MEITEAIEVVKDFNKNNRFRDGGKVNNSIEMLLQVAEYHRGFYKLDNHIRKDKIKELILKKQKQIQENNKEIEKCRKTIMEEQEIKRLRLYTLHKNNDLLELEIADLFDLLKEE